MKKKYISPNSYSLEAETTNILKASQLDPNADGNQSIIFSDEEADEFTSRRHNVWEDEDEDF